jgi:predicted PurR-regulated permease PerM
MPSGESHTQAQTMAELRPNGRRWPAYLAALIVFLALVYLLNAVLLPFVAGMAVAYILDPVCDRLERMGCSRLLATALVTTAFALVIVIGLLILVPMLVDQVMLFVAHTPDLVANAQTRLLPFYERLSQHIDLPAPEEISQMLRERLGSILGFLGNTVQGIASGGAAIASLLSLLFITPIVTFYLLRDWDVLVARLDALLPRDHAVTIRAQVQAIDSALAGFARGQASVCLILGIYYSLGLILTGLPFGVVIGMATGILSFIPYVGFMSGVIVGMFFALATFDGWQDPALVALVFFIGQILETNILTPKLVGDRVGLHPVWIIFALLAGGTLFGFLGLLLAVPVAAAAGVLVRFGVSRYRLSPLYLGRRQIAPGGDTDGGS